MDAEYDFSGGERGKHSARFKRMRLKSTPSQRTMSPITEQERLILQLLAQGLTIDQMAAKLSPKRRALRTLISKMSRLAADPAALVQPAKKVRR